MRLAKRGASALARQLLALGFQLQDDTVIVDDVEGRRCVFLTGLYRAERKIAEKLKALSAGEPPWPSIEAGKAIPWTRRRPSAIGSRPIGANYARALAAEASCRH